MRSLWLVLLVGLATEFYTEKILVSSQLPSAVDDLYLEGRSSGDLPIDDEDGGDDDDSSGSGSGDYVNITDEAELLKFLNFTKTPFGPEMVTAEPLQPQQTTTSSPVFESTTAATTQEPETTARDSAPTTPTARDNEEEVVDLGPTVDRATKATSPVPPSSTTAMDNRVESEIEETVVKSDFDIPETAIENEIQPKDGRSGIIYDIGPPQEVTSENLWERTEVLAAVIACGVVGFLCAVFLLLLLAYRMKKKDEGSYDLGETKLTNTAYHKAPTKEFYA